MIIKDAGHGITVKSLDLWKARRKELGKVLSLQGYFEREKSEYTLVIKGEKGEMWLSGCNCGYGGEGPHGTFEILQDVGVSRDHAEKLMLQRGFTINLGETYDF